MVWSAGLRKWTWGRPVPDVGQCERKKEPSCGGRDVSQEELCCLSLHLSACV